MKISPEKRGLGYRNHLSPPQFPAPWAMDWGEDKYGLWMSFALHQVCQTLRWIKPGDFLMGAAKNEKGKRPWLGKESQHQVTLSKGFWLADTTITQELWYTVMGTAPSGFTGEQHPVERISWQDARTFLRRLNKLISGLAARLPTEAEWEYACRAGTNTPFSFGKDISSEQANFNGKYPYRPTPLGEYRKRTVAVKTLPCNTWGLYAMHGNVWEWCQDYWQEDLGKQDCLNPQGPKRGKYRLVRGGSWASDACFIRSACRDRFPPHYCLGSVGVRLAISAT
ncbi:MAG: formylglycine-generating enzyme family protein [Candidatus Electrothrix aestuarii]|uniref:Formylglycine-generating enzyme family protein n=1 Tax=Candidatus Electrothrix aestuarii TaxID=3062594 RepID=A0AAU8LTJ9_9BACT|nr:formylglycine-generating enzyme family protein [Candidatus Electrothrix aestuarii]